jgi:hypothetical protein
MARQKNRQTFEKMKRERKRREKQEEKRQRRFCKDRPETDEFGQPIIYDDAPEGAEQSEDDTGLDPDTDSGPEQPE